MSTTAAGDLKTLRETLEKTLEEKRVMEQKFADGSQRMDARLEEINKMIANYIDDLHSLEHTLRGVTPSPAVEPPVVMNKLYGAPSPKAKPDSFELRISKWVINAIIVVVLFLLIWAAASFIKVPKGMGGVREACAVSSRLQERIQERRTASQPRAKDTLSDAVLTDVNPDKSKIHLAVVDLIMDLNMLDSAYVSNRDISGMFEQAAEKWEYLQLLYEQRQSVVHDDTTEKTVKAPVKLRSRLVQRTVKR